MAAEAIRLGAQPIRVMRIDSESEEGVHYLVTSWGQRRYTCNCPGFVTHHHCKHWKYLFMVDKPENAVGNIMWDANRGLSLNVWVTPDTGVDVPDADGNVTHEYPEYERVIEAMLWLRDNLPQAAAPAPRQESSGAQAMASAGGGYTCPKHNVPMKFFKGRPDGPAWMKDDKYKCTRVVIPQEQSNNNKPVYCNEAIVVGA
jgi:hypothetical protein